MALLQQNGLKLMTYQQALALLDKNPVLKAQLKGKWFYLDGRGLEESGYHAFDDEGKLTEGKGDIEKTVYVYSGKNPLSLYVLSAIAYFYRRRFNLFANLGSHILAPVVVGIRADHEVATPETEDSA